MGIILQSIAEIACVRSATTCLRLPRTCARGTLGESFLAIDFERDHPPKARIAARTSSRPMSHPTPARDAQLS